MKRFLFSALLCAGFSVCAVISKEEQEKLDMQLFFAASGGKEEAAKALLQKGANVDARDFDEDTPLTTAAASNHPHIVKLLLEKGANPNLKNDDGKTVYTIAKKRPAIAQAIAEFEKENKMKEVAPGGPSL